MRSVLITGGAGYIGSHVVLALLDQTNDHITIIDNLSTGFASTIEALKSIAPERVVFKELDLKDHSGLENFLKANSFDAVMHFAASLIVSESVQNPLKYYLNNTTNTIHFIALCQRYGISHFIFSSTAAVYGEPTGSGIVDETTSLAPINPYGESKRMSEQVLADTAARSTDFRYVALRYFNVAGADVAGRLGQNTENATLLIKVAAETAIGKRSAMSIFGDDYPTRDGTCIRDYIHVSDLANAHLAALEYLQDHEGGVFNCGYGEGYSVKEVIETMQKVHGEAFTVQNAPRREGDPSMLVANSQKITHEMGWVPCYNDLEMICKTTLDWEKQVAKQ